MADSQNTIPAFPLGLKLAPIAIVSSAKLLTADASERARVLDACKTHGFFYLDLRGSAPGQQLLFEAEQVHANARDVFFPSLGSPENRARYMMERGGLFGLKAAGTIKATDCDARPDSTEFICVAKDHLHGVTPSREYPPAVEAARPLLADFARHGYECGMQILRTLAVEMGLPENTFVELNNFSRPSGDHVRMTRKMPVEGEGESNKVIGLVSHTDFGSVTVLFNWLGGLQIQLPDDKEWAWVRPMPGHAVINMGDAMVKFTNGAVKSAKHRVVPVPGAQGALDRYSVVYFVRPHDDAPMKPVPAFANEPQVKVAGKFSDQLESGTIYTAGEWNRLRTMQIMSN